MQMEQSFKEAHNLASRICITRSRLAMDFNRRDQDDQQRQYACQFCTCRATEADHHRTPVLAMFGSKEHPIYYERLVQLYIREKQLALFDLDILQKIFFGILIFLVTG
jgi:hypothetical protein